MSGEVPVVGSGRGAAAPRKDGFYYPEGRRFREVPRVMRCVNGKHGIVFAHGADNPWAQPRATFELWRKAPLEVRLIRLYGLALRQMGARFGKFERKIHVIPDSAVPKEGSNYMVVDPHVSRNFAMGWVRCVKGTHHYIYREWPGSLASLSREERERVVAFHKGRETSWNIPGVGDPGMWAENDAKRPDGKPGPAQRKFNFGLLDYKREIARLEGWKDFKDAAATGFDFAKCKTISQWSDWHGADEKVFERIVDSRAASSPRVENDRPVTLLTSLEDIGLPFTLAKGFDVDAADPLIDSLLAFDREKPVDFLNSPKLFVAESCVNFIYMFENYTGLTAEMKTDFDSACKEQADILRYYLLADPVDASGVKRVVRKGVYL